MRCMHRDMHDSGSPLTIKANFEMSMQFKNRTEPNQSDMRTLIYALLKYMYPIPITIILEAQLTSLSKFS